jgi:natural product precursor
VFGKSTKKLNLNRETVRALSGREMQTVVGGLMSGASHGCSCTCNWPFTKQCPGNFAPRAVAL